MVIYLQIEKESWDTYYVVWLLYFNILCLCVLLLCILSINLLNSHICIDKWYFSVWQIMKLSDWPWLSTTSSDINNLFKSKLISSNYRFREVLVFPFNFSLFIGIYMPLLKSKSLVHFKMHHSDNTQKIESIWLYEFMFIFYWLMQLINKTFSWCTKM